MSRMMIKCKGEITAEQLAQVQKYRLNTSGFKEVVDYEDLISIDWDDLMPKPDEKEVEAEKKKQA